MDRPFIVENARERQRLHDFVARMTDQELSLSLEMGWTVASALAHLAFWDQRSLVLSRRWKMGEEVALSPVDTDLTNDALLPLCLAIPPRAAAELALAAAEAVDGEIEKLSPDLIARIEALGDRFRLYRCVHRKMHLDQIEARLNTKSAG